MLSSLGNETIKVTVGDGEEQQHYTLHKNLLIQKSSYFRAALTADFKEAVDGAITLSEEDPSTFQHFVQWLYTGSVLKPPSTTAECLTRVYVLGDRLQCPDLQSVCYKEIRFVLQKTQWPSVAAVKYLYENTASGCELRTFYAEVVSWDILHKIYTRSSQWDAMMESTIEFAADVGKCIAKCRKMGVISMHPFDKASDLNKTEALSGPPGTQQSSSRPKFVLVSP